MKALCLVAHPDDCVIFGLSYIHHHPEYCWTVGYLTYTAADPRGAEIASFWQRCGIDTVFLGFEDHWHDNEQKQYTRWTEESAEQACWRLARQYDLVLTHDEWGDYGHIHHALVHAAVRWHPKLVTFARPGSGTVEFLLPHTAYSADELPTHYSVIKGFHPDQHKNTYREYQ